MKFDVVFGTRPEAIKLCPFVLQARQEGHQVRVVFTGQHREMVEPILDLFNIQPEVRLDVMTPGQTLNDVFLRVSQGLTLLWRDKDAVPDYVVVQGDTTTCMAGGLVAFHERIPVLHVEAGLRTGDLSSPWPEEFNRRVVGLTAAIHAAPTAEAAENLYREAVSRERVCVVGNTGIDALMRVRTILQDSAGSVAQQLKRKFSFLESSVPLILATLHRRESFGQPLEEVFGALKTLSVNDNVQILVPLHMNPQVRKSASQVFGLDLNQIEKGEFKRFGKIIFSNPVDYAEMVYLMMKSYFIISDSGGLQEEAPSLGKPLLVARETTERPEAIASGCARLVGTDSHKILEAAQSLLVDQNFYSRMAQARFPYGAGDSCQKILRFVCETH